MSRAQHYRVWSLIAVMWVLIVASQAFIWSTRHAMRTASRTPPTIPCKQGMTLLPGQSCYGSVGIMAGRAKAGGDKLLSDDGAGRTRAEHLEWCKQRALEYVDLGQLSDAVASMLSDLSKHPDTRSSSGAPFARLGVAALMSQDPREVRRFITGFN